VETEHLRIHSTDAEKAASVALLAENALRRIKKDILINTPDITQKIEVFLWETPGDFRNSVANANISETGISRLFLADDGSITRRIDVLLLDSVVFVLPHEIAHLLLGELDIIRHNNGQPSIPLAFHEGIAILAEGRCNDDMLMRAGMNMSCAAINECADANGHLTHFNELMSRDDYTRLDDSCDFYAEGYSLAEFLVKELKPAGLSRLLRYLEKGETFDTAVQLAMGDTSENFKQNFIAKWHAHAKNNTNALIAMR
jgi:hypothetical protein